MLDIELQERFEELQATFEALQDELRLELELLGAKFKVLETKLEIFSFREHAALKCEFEVLKNENKELQKAFDLLSGRNEEQGILRK